MTPDPIARLMVNLDVVLQHLLMFCFVLQMLMGTAIAGWQMRTIEGRREVAALVAVEESDLLDGLFTMLTIPTLALLVVLFST